MSGVARHGSFALCFPHPVIHPFRSRSSACRVEELGSLDLPCPKFLSPYHTRLPGALHRWLYPPPAHPLPTHHTLACLEMEKGWGAGEGQRGGRAEKGRRRRDAEGREAAEVSLEKSESPQPSIKIRSRPPVQGSPPCYAAATGRPTIACAGRRGCASSPAAAARARSRCGRTTDFSSAKPTSHSSPSPAGFAVYRSSQ